MWLKYNKRRTTNSSRKHQASNGYEERKPIPFLTADRNMRDNAICSDESFSSPPVYKSARETRDSSRERKCDPNEIV